MDSNEISFHVLKSPQCKHKFKYHNSDADIIIKKENDREIMIDQESAPEPRQPSMEPAITTRYAEVDKPIDATPSQNSVRPEQPGELTVPLFHPPPSKTGSDSEEDSF